MTDLLSSRRRQKPAAGEIALRVLKGIAPYVLLLSALCLLTASLIFARYGFEFTDDSYNLIWLAEPQVYDFGVMTIGFVLHPLYRLLAGDIGALRQVNILATYVLSAALFIVVLRRLRLFDALRRHESVAVVAALACSALLAGTAVGWTPSYNTLTVQGLVVAVIGLMAARPERGLGAVAAWTCIGVGGWLTFMGKLSSAAALAVVAVVWLIVDRRWSMRYASASIAAAAALTLGTVFAIDGSISRYVERLWIGFQLLQTMESGHSLSLWQLIRRFGMFRWSWPQLLATALVALVAARTAPPLVRRLGIPSLHFAAAPVLVTACVVGASFALGFGFVSNRGMVVFAAWIAALAATAFLQQRRAIRHLDRGVLVAACALAIIPFVWAFGSNINYWRGQAGVFWIASAICILALYVPSNFQRSTLLAYGAAVPVLCSVALIGAWQSPYRQPQPLWKNDELVAVGPMRSELWLPASFAEHLHAIEQRAKDAGLPPGQWIIDLTGMSPGAIFHLGARSVGQPWLIGGFPGSGSAAELVLDNVSCEVLAQAWVLSGRTNMHTTISPAVLESFGADLERDFIPAAVWTTTVGVSGSIERQTQILHRPIRSAMAAAETCSRINRRMQMMDKSVVR